MRKFTAIILFTAFITAQYATQISYLECRLANYFKAPDKKCDCEKLPGVEEGANDQSPFPVRHNHVHIDDSYFQPFCTIHVIAGINNCIPFNIIGFFSLKDGLCSSIDHPPQFI